jgi:hypothetical protein
MSRQERRPEIVTVGAILGRIRDMACLWLFFGALIGACTPVARDGSLIGVVSGMLAGMIVLPFLGVGLGVAGGQVMPTLVGGSFGAVCAVLAGFAHGSESFHDPLCFGLILGGLAGGTISVITWWIALFRRVLRLAQPAR